MDYFKEAFDGFKPHIDEDAALKFSLNALVTNHRIEKLMRLISPDSDIDGVEGEPGWIIERRDDREILGYERWPEGARFRAYVDPEIYSLVHPEFFCDKLIFFRYVRAIANVYARRCPEMRGTLVKLQTIVGGATI